MCKISRGPVIRQSIFITLSNRSFRLTIFSSCFSPALSVFHYTFRTLSSSSSLLAFYKQQIIIKTLWFNRFCNRKRSILFNAFISMHRNKSFAYNHNNIFSWLFLHFFNRIYSFTSFSQKNRINYFEFVFLTLLLCFFFFLAVSVKTSTCVKQQNRCWVETSVKTQYIEQHIRKSYNRKTTTTTN